jgi:hypothetical protein
MRDEGEFKKRDCGTLFAKIDAILQNSQWTHDTPLAISNKVFVILDEARKDILEGSWLRRTEGGDCLVVPVKKWEKWFGIEEKK